MISAALENRIQDASKNYKFISLISAWHLIIKETKLQHIEANNNKLPHKFTRSLSKLEEHKNWQPSTTCTKFNIPNNSTAEIPQIYEDFSNSRLAHRGKPLH